MVKQTQQLAAQQLEPPAAEQTPSAVEDAPVLPGYARAITLSAMNFDSILPPQASASSVNCGDHVKVDSEVER
jgi:hypothetical protein